MVVVRICGGLGNQMFQHAAGYALAKRLGGELKWDLSWFDTCRLHQGFELERVFDFTYPAAVSSDYRSILGWRGGPRIRPLLARRWLRWARPDTYFIEPHFHYWSTLESISGSAYLDGYWQSQRYFITVAEWVREEFSFARQMDRANLDLAKMIGCCDSVSVHVRRGDYVSNPTINTAHGVCSIDYYQAAIAEIESRVNKPRFFVFSDDPVWAKSNLRFDGDCVFIDVNNGNQSFNDMRLMSLCQHHVIANSSFSWWAAWLGHNKKKLVIAPKRWFNAYAADTRDLYCPTWLVL